LQWKMDYDKLLWYVKYIRTEKELFQLLCEEGKQQCQNNV
jgi:hypothetical protein